MYAFKLTDEFADFSGGSVVCSGLGHAFDVKAGLDQGDGVIVTDNDILAAILARYPALERVPQEEIPEGAAPVELPHADVMVTQTTAPFTPQTPQPPPSTPPETLEAIRNTLISQQVAAEHSDAATDSESVEQAITAGEDVSGDQSTQIESSGFLQ